MACSCEIRPPLKVFFAHPGPGLTRVLVEKNIGRRKEYLAGAGTPYRTCSTPQLQSLLFSSQFTTFRHFIAFIEFCVEVHRWLKCSHLPADENSGWYPVADNFYQVYILRFPVWSTQRWWTCVPASWRFRRRRWWSTTTTTTTTTTRTPWIAFATSTDNLDKLAIKFAFTALLTFAYFGPVNIYILLLESRSQNECNFSDYLPHNDVASSGKESSSCTTLPWHHPRLILYFAAVKLLEWLKL